jgi:hypothetical protein
MIKTYSKAVLVIFVLTFMASNGFARPELSLKAGGNAGVLVSNTRASVEYRNIQGPEVSETISEGVSDLQIGAEILFPLNDNLIIGAGMLYIWATPLLSASDYVSLRYAPVYATIQINPFPIGLFFKGNIGFVSFFSVALNDKNDALFSSRSHKGGLYLGLSLGYEFNSGWFIEITEDFISSSFSGNGETPNDYNYGYDGMKHKLDCDFSYIRTGVSFGYKFLL